MFRSMIRAMKWRKLRLRVWEKRLNRHLDRLTAQWPDAMPCSLTVHWGPLYGGSVALNRACTRARLILQLPYDRYTAPEEQFVMARYSLPSKALPVFILFHEFYHLLDISDQLRLHGKPVLGPYRTALLRAARIAPMYKELEAERAADDFAYRRYRDITKRAG